MKILRAVMAFACLAVLSGCGGGGSSGPKPLPTLKTTLSAVGNTVSVNEGTTASSFTVNVTSSGSASTPVIPSVSYDNTVYASVTAVAGTTAGTYVITATPVSDLGGATYAAPITFRLCQETACTHIYPGSTATYAYNLTVKLHDWAMFQRDAAHTGYVHTTLDAAKFKQAWTWTNPAGNFMSAVVSGNGSAFVSAAPGKVYSFNEMTGAQNWAYDLLTPTEINSPGALAFANGKVYVPAFVTIPGSTFYGTGTVRGLDASTGAFVSDSGFISQISTFNSPTVYNDEMFYSQGYYGGVLWKYSLPSGTTSWQTTSIQANQYGGETPAVDTNYVYYSSGWGLTVFNKSDGSVYADISSPRLYSALYDSLISPVIARSGHVIIGNQEHGNYLEAIDVASRSVIWQSADNYNLQPVVAGDTVYAARLYPQTVDAISDTDGSVLWSWAMPAGDTQFGENMVVCDNLLFVSTDKNIYAIDLKTHQTVWTFAAHGRLSLSSNYILYAVANDYGIGGMVTAINLRG
jgi:outer membrane protein assembly factor BamB